MKKLFFYLLLLLVPFVASAQFGTFTQLRLRNNIDSVSTGAQTGGTVRYDPVTGKVRYYDGICLCWRSWAFTGSAGAVADGDKGDITVSSTGTIWTLDATINKSWTGTHSFLDNSFTLLDNSDPTKILSLQLSGISAGTTRTLTIPDASGTLLLNNQAWLTTGTTTLTGVATITSNTSLQHVFNGTWTATANNDYHANFTGIFTGRNTASDTFVGYKFTPTMISGAATQRAWAVEILPTFGTAGGAFTVADALRVGGRVHVTNNMATAGGSAMFNIIGVGLATANSIQIMNSAGTDRFSMRDNGQVNFTAAVPNPFTITSTFSATASGQAHTSIFGTFTGEGVVSRTYRSFVNGTSFTSGAATQDFTVNLNAGTYTFNHANGILRGFYHNPTLAGSQLASLTHLAFHGVTGDFLLGGATITNSSAIMDLQSTSKAFIPTRVTNTAAIAAPADAMFAYDAATGMHIFRQASAWYNGTMTAGLTATRLLFASAANIAVDDADLTFTTATNTLTAARVVTTATSSLPGLNIGAGVSSDPSTVVAGDLWINTTESSIKIDLAGTTRYILKATLGNLVDGRIPIVTSGGGAGTGGIATDSDLTFSGSTLTATQFITTAARVGTALSTPRILTLESNDASTNTVFYNQRTTRTSSGTPANGIGTGIEFEVETSASNNEIGALLDVITSDVSSGSEDFYYSFKTMSAGASAAERLTIDSSYIKTATGDFTVDNDAKGLILKSPDGHYWRVQVTNLGALTTTDLGTSL